MEYWDRLLRRLHDQFGLPIVTVGGPGDTGLGPIPGIVTGEGRLSVAQTGYLLTQATGFIGNLSGPAHLAAALGVPTITLMSGHSLPVEWAPINQRSGRSLLLRAPVPCAPCHRRICPGYGIACLTELKPEVVWEDVERFLVDAMQ
jgi:ADP-heptose:LPS heptosyltransferase